jgi:hypothetical protein
VRIDDRGKTPIAVRLTTSAVGKSLVVPIRSPATFAPALDPPSGPPVRTRSRTGEPEKLSRARGDLPRFPPQTVRRPAAVPTPRAPTFSPCASFTPPSILLYSGLASASEFFVPITAPRKLPRVPPPRHGRLRPPETYRRPALVLLGHLPRENHPARSVT